ncbi:zinc finger protein 845-like [Agrilus planipennis]|uniref:Zinc finger protein 845-like n=1 Tax=Agrilus planipennis TaxID=224129 RepID=A0A1W4XWR2_AGRPL|nr:zinc finger protein 845-like [Agrilus planipennis]
MAQQTFGNYSSCCRLCLSENSSSLKSVFDSSTSRSSLSQRIYTSLGIEIEASDKISTMICQSCIGILNEWDKYKRSCLINQRTLELRMQNWNSNQIADVSLQIKDETLYDEVDDTARAVNDEEREGAIKEEPMETEQYNLDDSFEDLPPPLTPHPPESENIFNEDNSSTSFNDETVNSVPSGDSRVCSICDKVFSSVSNKNKHERTIHANKNQEDSENTKSQNSEVCIDDENSSGLHSCNGETNMSDAQPIPATVDNFTSESDQQKIQFAANLKLKLQHHATPSPSPYTFNGFTKIETSYLEKCKAMIKMNETFICICHNEQLHSFKQILQHIRKNPIWFPCYTCFNCMITFTDRSTYMKHYASCPKEKLRNLKRLAEAKENTEMKVRLYQLYVCMLCHFIFAYHEDFCQHVNTFHVGNSETETSCKKCSTTFETADALRRHMYLSSCIMNYRCDICGKIMGSMTEFKAHCELEHDSSEGFSLESKDNYRKRVSAPAELIKRPEEVKRRNREAPRLEPEATEVTEEREKVVNPHALVGPKKKSRSACHVCGKVYSSYHNMMRHAKTHDQSLNTLMCKYCPETFRLVVQLKQHENEVHNINKSPDQVPRSKSTPRNVKEFKYSCLECKATFDDLVKFTKHKDMHRLPCEDCGKKFTTQKELDQHRSVHLNIKVYRDSKTQNYKSSMVSALLMCEVCDKVFDTKEELVQHKSLHEQMPILTAQDRPEDDKKDNTKKYSCQVCNKTYLGYGGLWEHNNKHHPGRKIPREYPRQCKYCDKMLFTGGSWYMHKQMHERLSFQSQKVSNNTNHVNDAKSAAKKTTSKDSDDAESYFTCKKCFKVFSSKYNLRNHMKCHGINTNSTSRAQSKLGNKSKTYWCDVCHQACLGLAELQKHKLEHVEEGIPQLNNEIQAVEPKKLHIFLCDLCDKDFTTKFALKKHKERHDLECTPIQKKRYFYCKHCKIPFKNMTILEDHMQGEHNESVAPKPHTNQSTTTSNKHPCSVCKKVFDTASALSSHQGWHKRGKVEKQLRTQEKLFRKMVNSFPSKEDNKKQQNELQPQHQTPTEMESFQCLTCFLQFSNETALQLHVLEAHRKIDTKQIVVFHCDPCNLDFETQLAYNKHQQLHKVVEQQKTNQQQHHVPPQVIDGQKVSKNFSCKYCPANFTRSDHLNAHIKENHREFIKKNFKCTQCDRLFEKQNALSTHLKVHERQKQVAGTEKSIDKLPKKFYSCSICHVGFPIAKDLRNHIISTHPF